MGEPIRLICEICNEKSDVLMNSHIDDTGKRIEWPKAAVRSEGIYFTIACPNCGDREQCVSRPSDTE